MVARWRYLRAISHKFMPFTRDECQIAVHSKASISTYRKQVRVMKLIEYIDCVVFFCHKMIILAIYFSLSRIFLHVKESYRTEHRRSKTCKMKVNMFLVSSHMAARWLLLIFISFIHILSYMVSKQTYRVAKHHQSIAFNLIMKHNHSHYVASLGRRIVMTIRFSQVSIFIHTESQTCTTWIREGKPQETQHLHCCV